MGTIVVGVDGSEESLGALRWAQDMAGTRHSVRVVHVWGYPVAGGAAVGFAGGVSLMIPFEELEASARSVLDGVLAAVDADGVDRSGELVMTPSAAAGLLEAAAEADLLVVGTRHHSAMGRLLAGSVAVQCAHHASCPFVAVPVDPPPLGDLVAVAYDGSESAQGALRWAAALAAERGERLRVIQVWEQIGSPAGPQLADPPRTIDEQALDQLRDAVGDVLPDVADTVEYRPVHAPRDVADHLMDAADGASLLVLGHRGLGGFTGLLLGSVSQRCLLHSTIPVALVRH